MSVVMQQSPQPDVRERGSRAMSWRQQLINLGSIQIASADIALKAITDGNGRQVLPAGHSSTQQKFREEFERLPQVLEQAMRIYETALNLEIAGSSANSTSQVIVVYRPGAVTGSEPGVYGTWADLMAFVATVTSVVAVQFDDSLAPVVIPAGTHVFPHGSIFAGQFNLPFVQVAFDDGAVLEGVRSFIRGIQIVNASNSPVITVGPGLHLITFERGAEPFCVGTAPFILADGAGTQCIIALYGAQLLDGGMNQPVVESVNSSFVLINPVVASTIEDNTLGNDATGFIQVQKYADTVLGTSQPDILGILAEDLIDQGNQVAFDPALKANQLGASTVNVQAAIDVLTEKHVNRRSQTQTGAGTLTVAADSPKLILVDMSGAGAGVANIDLPDPAVDSGPWKVKRVDSNGSATVNIRGTAGAQVDGAASQTLGTSPASANLETDGTNWYRV